MAIGRRAVWLAIAGLALLFSYSAGQAVAAEFGPPGGSITADRAHEAAAAGDLILVDIRTPAEWRQTGAPKDAERITLGTREFGPKLMALLETSGETPIALICARGNRSSHVLGQLKTLGLLERFYHVPEGMMGSSGGPGWIKRGLPVERN